jgi:hypothetical protein
MCTRELTSRSSVLLARACRNNIRISKTCFILKHIGSSQVGNKTTRMRMKLPVILSSLFSLCLLQTGLVCGVSVNQTMVKLLSSTLSSSDQKVVIGGATLQEKTSSTSTSTNTAQSYVKAFTICIRFNLKVLGTNAKGEGTLLNIGDTCSVNDATNHAKILSQNLPLINLFICINYSKLLPIMQMLLVDTLQTGLKARRTHQPEIYLCFPLYTL